MHYSRRTGILLAVALLIVSLAAPAAAKKGGNPGAPSGAGLEVTVESYGFMWANSVGDEILFDITVTNTSGALLKGVVVEFRDTWLGSGDATLTWGKDNLTTGDLEENASGTWQHRYTVVGSISLDGNTGDFRNAPISEQTQVKVGTVTAAVDGTVLDSDDFVMLAYPVLPCDQEVEDGSFTFGPNAEYSECSFIGSGDWQLTTTLEKPPRGNSTSPSATVRDGIPGNWCSTGESVVEGMKVTDYQFFPPNGTCLVGGMGGEEIPVRNITTFYLATWKGNTVDAVPVSAP